MLSDFEQEINKRIGMRIKHRREEYGYTQTQLAVALGVTFQQIQKYENGKNRISAPKMHTLCVVLDVRPEWLFGWR